MLVGKRCKQSADGLLLPLEVAGQSRYYQVKGLGGAILEVGTQASFQVFGRDIPLGLYGLLCTAVQLTEVQCCPVPHLSGQPCNKSRQFATW